VTLVEALAYEATQRHIIQLWKSLPQSVLEPCARSGP